ncbi:hypothetical protein TW79_12370 [Tritonibacter mobilis]|uniref:DUF6950 domain-containing protein n=2 Tax=Tritonibacter mobilis TaxID=379347 RepID=A0A1B1A093_9RHOB|nr:hypothetical protein K529_004080 [Tritonibacter mobilis F1926]KJZ23824.1 hypothetical protein TW79_12370 [Tritonibacter mobilis]
MGDVMQDRPEMLLHYLRGVRLRWSGFRPGRVDCANYAHGWYKLVTGTDIRARLGIEYTTLQEGKEALRAKGYRDLAALAASYMPEVDTADAALGDIAALSDGSEIILGIIGGPQVHVLTLAGPSVLSRCKAERVFRP